MRAFEADGLQSLKYVLLGSERAPIQYSKGQASSRVVSR
jgi:hypothetical protein